MKVQKYPTPILSEKCKLVEESDLEEIKAVYEEMKKICLNPKTLGVGLAANQVGINKDFFITKYPNQVFNIYINPLITSFSNETEIKEEGCLSFNKKLKYPIKRSLSIVMDYIDLSEYKVVTKEFHNMEARIIQHEVDHLNGITMYDRWKEQTHNS